MAIIKCTVARDDWWEMYIEYSVSQSVADKISTVTHALKLKRIGSARFSGNMDVDYTIGSETFSYDKNFNATGMAIGDVKTVKSGTTKITHNSTTGDASFDVTCSGTCNSGGYGTGNISLSKKTITLARLPLYDLTISAGTGSSVTVNRTSSGGGGSTGNLSAGTNKLYYGDKLKITFKASTNYGIVTHTVNKSAFTSGNTHTVGSDVSVMATAQMLSSTVTALDANIGSATNITISSNNTSYYHSLRYSFGSLSGWISKDGSIVSTEEKFTGKELIGFIIPESFYGQIPNKPSDKCTITCNTYQTATSARLGDAKTCQFTVTAPKSECAPQIVSATVIDTNAQTKSVTGNDKTLVLYKSTAQVTFSVTPLHNASISKIQVNGVTVTGTAANDGTISVTKEYHEVNSSNFVIKVTDSRGYDDEQTLEPTVINYVPLTFYPTISRKPPSGDGANSEIVVSFKGDYYNGSFAPNNEAYKNVLLIQYKYKERGDENASYSNTYTIDNSKVISGTNTYSSADAISLGEEYDYQKTYDFLFTVSDGTSLKALSRINTSVPTLPAIPVFDWGAKDFRFNVPVNGQSINVNDVISETVSTGNIKATELMLETLNLGGYDVSDLYYKPGDVVRLNSNTFAGYVSSGTSAGSKSLYFTIPLNKLNKASKVTLSGNIIGRGVNGYINDTTYTNGEFTNTIDLSDIKTYTISATLSNDCIAVIITSTETIANTTNNTPVAVAPVGGYITATFS